MHAIHTVCSYDEHSVKDKIFFMGSRGCPYGCTYCCNDTIRSIYPDHSGYYRLKPVDSIISEMRDHVERNPRTKFIRLYDDVLMGNKKWFEYFCERYKAEINIGCFMTGRWELLTEHTIPLLKKIRCYFILIGVEVGNEELRCKILKRNQKTEMMMERAELLRKHKVRYGLYTMVGLPTETLENALETVKLAARLKGNLIVSHHSIFFPFPSTPLNDLCEALGFMSNRTVGSYFDDSRLDMPTFPRAQVVWAHRQFKRFFLAYWLVLKLPGRLVALVEKRLDRLWMIRGQKVQDDSAGTEGR
jgi:MoaA/NifB/PqqE/SkfB family radical SAM enzyme